MRAQLDVDWVVAGSLYVVTGDKLRLDVALQDARSGDTIITLTDTAPRAELIDIVTRIGIKLREALGLHPHDPAGERQTRAALPADQKRRASTPRRWCTAAPPTPSSRAICSSARWRATHVRPRPLGARRHLPRSRRRRQSARRSRARVQARRQLAARRAPPARGALPQSQRRLGQGDRDLSRAAHLLPRRSDLRPVAGARAGLGRRIRKTPSRPSPSAPAAEAALRRSVDRLHEARAWAKQGDWKRRLAADQRAIDKGAPTGSGCSSPTRETGAAEALIYLGDPKKARPLYEAAKKTYDELGDRKGAASAAVSLADLLLDSGDAVGARAQYEQALAVHRDNGYEFGQADVLNRVAQTYQAEGQLARALDDYAQRWRTSPVNEREGIGNITNNSADVLMLEGEVTEAERRYRAAQARFREVGMHTYDVAVMTQIALALRREARLAEAMAENGSAAAKLAPIGDKGRELAQRVEEALEKREADDLAGAEALLDKSKGFAADAFEGDQRSLRIMRAEVALDRGKIDEATREARTIADEAASASRASDEADARELLARALFAAGKKSEAAAAIIARSRSRRRASCAISAGASRRPPRASRPTAPPRSASRRSPPSSATRPRAAPAIAGSRRSWRAPRSRASAATKTRRRSSPPSLPKRARPGSRESRAWRRADTVET